jgi:hypothetical protein
MTVYCKDKHTATVKIPATGRIVPKIFILDSICYLILLLLLTVDIDGDESKDNTFILGDSIALNKYTKPETSKIATLNQNGIVIGLSELILRVTVFCILLVFSRYSGIPYILYYK